MGTNGWEPALSATAAKDRSKRSCRRCWRGETCPRRTDVVQRTRRNVCMCMKYALQRATAGWVNHRPTVCDVHPLLHVLKTLSRIPYSTALAYIFANCHKPQRLGGSTLLWRSGNTCTFLREKRFSFMLETVYGFNFDIPPRYLHKAP